ncbi:MAG: hypothetical protein UT24_C0011G0019 [Candidatus Woesebacteria bacterium GW2011_GWB1_39_12]|uniref:Uncharacterized protein n=1 Tax=Candidatus Woesebacteria bacterium GW2011_GWB1_39_12 TaxID=1618574 RepID=A0A0G0MJJ8_9BACT|nr:MAG: hypothetical protein UT24_C0011G0019 [Candidatus Woesebacteria bacterium GW2011_GWB1_39_12]
MESFTDVLPILQKFYFLNSDKHGVFHFVSYFEKGKDIRGTNAAFVCQSEFSPGPFVVFINHDRYMVKAEFGYHYSYPWNPAWMLIYPDEKIDIFLFDDNGLLHSFFPDEFRKFQKKIDQIGFLTDYPFTMTNIITKNDHLFSGYSSISTFNLLKAFRPGWENNFK